MAVDSSGNIYYDESFSQTVSELAAGSTTPKVLFNAGGYATFLALDSNGNIYTVEGPATCNGQHGGASSIVKFDRTSQTVSTFISDSGGIGGVFITPSGDLYYTTCAGTVDEVPNGSSTTQIIVSGLNPSTGVAVDGQGDVFYTQYSTGVYVLPAGSSISVVVATEGGTHYGLALDDLGNVYYTDNLGGTVWEVPVNPTSTTSTTSTTTSTTASQYGTAQAVVTGQSAPVGVAVDGSGNLYWVNFGSGQLLSLASGGSSSPKVLLSGLSTPQGLGIDSAGNLYFTEYSAGTLGELKAGSSAKTVLASGLNAPNFLAVTSAGDVYFITGDTCGNTIMKYDHTTGTVSTVLARNMDTGHGFGGVFVDSSGNVYYSTCQSETVEVLPTGSSSPQVLASGIPYANGIVGDSSGNLFIDSYYSGVYMLPKGSTSPVEVTAQNTAHELIAIDNLGNIYFSDNTGGKIWEVPVASTTQTTTATASTSTTSSAVRSSISTSSTSTTFTNSTTTAPTNVTSTGQTTSTGPFTNSTTSTALTTTLSSNSTTFSQVLVHNGTSVSQSEINQFLANGTILGTINVGSNTAIFNGNARAHDTFNVSAFSSSGSLTIVIGAQGISGPRVLLVNISKDSFLNLQSGSLAVTLDNQTVPEAPSLQAVLVGFFGSTPSYILLGTSSGFQLLLSIPHFSTHTIVVTTSAKSVQVVTTTETVAAPSSGIPTTYIIGAIIVVAVVVTAMGFAIRSQRNKRIGSPN